MRFIIDKEGVIELISRQPELLVELEAGVKAAVIKYTADNRTLVTDAIKGEYAKFFGSEAPGGRGFNLSRQALDAVREITKQTAKTYLENSDEVALLINRVVNDELQAVIKAAVIARLKDVARTVGAA